jgi:tRNA (guanosine-2'-O-)-methyltransferase
MSPERFAKLCRVLDRRQPDLTVLMENVHKTHNVAAVMRTSDAIGISEVHAVYPEDDMQEHHLISGGTLQWISSRVHPDLDAAFEHLRGQGFKVLAAHLSDEAIDFREADYTRPTAILLGAEKDGVTPEAAKASDAHIQIPMMGMGPSLNVSVAAAVILFEAQRQRQEAGLYDRRILTPEVRAKRLFEWAYPKLSEFCQRKGLSYPRLDESGEIIDPIPH